MIDSIYDAVTQVSEHNDGIPHDRFVRRLMSLPQVRHCMWLVKDDDDDPHCGSPDKTQLGVSEDSGVDEQGTTSLFDSVTADRSRLVDLFTLSGQPVNGQQQQYTPRADLFLTPNPGNNHPSAMDSSLNLTHMSSLLSTAACSHR
jgi:hypothetical protein